MKKMMFALVTVIMLGGMVACNGGGNTEVKPQPKVVAPKVDVYVLRKEPDPAPEWLYDEDWIVAKDADGTKVIYFKTESQNPTQSKAMASLKADKALLLAGIIKQLTSSEMVRATEGMLNDEGEMDAYFSEIVAAISRNVDTSGAFPAGTYWEYVQEVEGENSTKYYRAVKRYQMDYAQFQAKLMGEVKKQAPRINEELKNKSNDFLDKMNSQLDALGE